MRICVAGQVMSGAVNVNGSVPVALISTDLSIGQASEERVVERG